MAQKSVRLIIPENINNYLRTFTPQAKAKLEEEGFELDGLEHFLYYGPSWGEKDVVEINGFATVFNPGVLNRDDPLNHMKQLENVVEMYIVEYNAPYTVITSPENEATVKRVISKLGCDVEIIGRKDNTEFAAGTNQGWLTRLFNRVADYVKKRTPDDPHFIRLRSYAEFL